MRVRVLLLLLLPPNNNRRTLGSFLGFGPSRRRYEAIHLRFGRDDVEKALGGRTAVLLLGRSIVRVGAKTCKRRIRRGLRLARQMIFLAITPIWKPLVRCPAPKHA
jgi:hypothetical protein